MSVATGGGGVLSFERLVYEVLGVAAHGDQFGGDADGDLMRGQRADFQTHGGAHAITFLRRYAFAPRQTESTFRLLPIMPM